MKISLNSCFWLVFTFADELRRSYLNAETKTGLMTLLNKARGEKSRLDAIQDRTGSDSVKDVIAAQAELNALEKASKAQIEASLNKSSP